MAANEQSASLTPFPFMRLFSPKTTGWISIATALFIAFIKPCIAQEAKADMQALMRETQQTDSSNHHLHLVWWIPAEFWSVSMEKNTAVTEKQKETLLKMFRDYNVIAVVQGEIGPMGGVTYEPEEDVRSQVTLIDTFGDRHRPMKTSDIKPDLQNFLEIMHPMLGNMMGPLGKNFQFMVFPARNNDGQFIMNPRAEGKFIVQLGEAKYRWRLPLSSLLPPKICPKCNEKLSGAFRFCPYDGTSLTR
jgi:hypothetical protein